MQSKINFSLTQLEYVLAVQKLGHFAKAAKHCAVTQPTLSMQIQKLEENLGVVLFDRTKKPILLTDAGEKIIEQMQNVVFEAKKIEDLLEDQNTQSYEGELVLGIIPTLAPYLLPRLLPSMEKMFPELRLRIFEMQTHKIVEALDDDQIDVGLLAIPLKNPQIQERSLFWEPFQVLANKTHSVSKFKKLRHSQLNSEEIWLLEEGHCLRHQVLDVCAMKKNRSKKRTFEFESGSLETLKNLVNYYGGLTLLPELATDSIGPNTKLIPFERPIPAREVGLVFRRKYHRVRLIDALELAIRDSTPATLKKLKAGDLDVIPIE